MADTRNGNCIKAESHTCSNIDEQLDETDPKEVSGWELLSSGEILSNEFDIPDEKECEDAKNSILYSDFDNDPTDSVENLMEKIGGSCAETLTNLLKSQSAFYGTQGHRYDVKLTSTGQRLPNAWIFRLDTPHKGYSFNDLNINREISGWPVDPHLPLPPGTLTIGRGVATAAETINKVILPVSLTIDAARTGYAVYEDYSNGTSRNTVETLTGIAGGWAGGFGGATAGTALGTAVLPGIGTIAGGLIGALSGGFGGAIGTTALVNTMGDACSYDMITKHCVKCGAKFNIRLYLGESKDLDLCPKCRKKGNEVFSHSLTM